MPRRSVLPGLICVVALGGNALAQQTPGNVSKPAETGKADKAQAYYYYSLGHLYAELAAAYGNRSDLFNKAVESYKQAMKADPDAGFMSRELSELYIQASRLRDAVTEAEDVLKQNPNDLNAHRLLGEIYTRMIGDPQQNKFDESMVKKAIEQYQIVTAKDPKDVESWLTLGRLDRVSQNSVEAQKAFKQALEIDPENEDALTQLGALYSDLGNTKGAAELFERAAKKNPTPRSLAALAGTYEQMKDYALAAETLKKAIELQPGNADLQRYLAKDLLFADKLDEALKIFQDLLAENPKDAQSELYISQIYRQKRDFAKAHEAATKAKELDPNDMEVQFNEINLLEAEGKIPDAISALKALLASTQKKSYSPPEKRNRVLLLEQLAFFYRQTEQWNLAVDTFRQLPDVDADMGAKAAGQVIETYRMSHDYAKAEAESDAASKKYPDDRTVRSARASLLSDQGKTEQAVAETKKLLNGKDDRETHLSLAQIYEKAKNYTEMAKELDAAEKLSHSKEEVETIHFMRGAMLERQKKYDLAEAEFRKVLDVDPTSAAALNYLGYMLADRNVRLEEARDMITKAVDREPNNAAYLDSLGWVYYRLNRLPEAEQSVRRALELMAKDPTVHDHLGDIYFQEGKTREAIAQWQSSVQDWKSSAPADRDEEELAKVQKKLDNAKVRLARESK